MIPTVNPWVRPSPTDFFNRMAHCVANRSINIIEENGNVLRKNTLIPRILPKACLTCFRSV